MLSPEIPDRFSEHNENVQLLSHPVPIGSTGWFQWLEDHHVFSFPCHNGTFTVHKTDNFWYAYHIFQGNIRTISLGTSQQVTLDRLQEVATTFATPQQTAVDTQLQPESEINALLMTKLSIPPIPHEIISRAQLLEKLNTGMKHKLTLVSASAGSGKTTLLSDWALHCPWPVAWFSVEELDNDPTRFWRYIIAALERVLPAISHQNIILQQPQTNVEAMITSLVNTLISLTNDVAFIIEDYHFISNQRIHQAIGFFIDHLPPQLHLFISSRVSPPLALARLRSRSHLNEIASHELTLSHHEVKLFLDKVMRLQVPDSMIGILAQHTEGWITGIQLAGLSLQRSPNTYDVMNNFTGNTTFIFEYLAEEVLQQQSLETQTFLLQTAVLNRLCAPLCTALTQLQPAQQMLAQLEQANLFIVPLDHRSYWFRYHHLFRDFLLRHLLQQHPEQVHHLHSQASIWYEQHQLLPEAIDHALAAEEMEKAAHLLIQIEQKMMRQNEVSTLQRWLNVFPEAFVREFPSLCLLQAWLYMITGQKTDLIETWLEGAQNTLPLEVVPDISATAYPSQETELWSMIAAIHAHLYNIKGDIPHAIEFVQQALTYLPKNDIFQQGIYELTLGSIYWLNEDITDAYHTFLKAQQAGTITDNLYILVFALYGQETTWMARNQYQQAFSLLQQILQLADMREECMAFWMTAAAYLDVGLLYYEWNKLEAAANALEKGIELSIKWEHKLMHMYGNTLLARVRQTQGDPTTARNIIQQTEQYVLYDSSYSWIVATAEAHRVRLALLQNETEVIEQWRPVSTCNYVHTLEQVTLARISLQRGYSEQAQAILEQIQQVVQPIGQIRILIEVLVLQALTLKKQDNLPQALNKLHQALTLAEPQAYARLFLDEGNALAELLNVLLSWTYTENRAPIAPIAQYIKDLLTAHGQSFQEDFMPLDSTAKHETTTTFSLLSTREIDITRLIAQGHSNRSIAQTLCLAESTVKWYIKNIYSKLDVHNRAQVVIRAQEIHLC